MKVDSFRPANLENVFRGTFRIKKRDLLAKSGTVGRAHIEIFLEVYGYLSRKVPFWLFKIFVILMPFCVYSVYTIVLVVNIAIRSRA